MITSIMSVLCGIIDAVQKVILEQSLNFWVWDRGYD